MAKIERLATLVGKPVQLTAIVTPGFLSETQICDWLEFILQQEDAVNAVDVPSLQAYVLDSLTSYCHVSSLEIR